ncbi:hypothetical protein MO867_06785 [Microbulbifer sp. OS29]|uniref:DUF3619 family protein n=1 Tax=Microbulbifer okhotskensis TaxID=2926617 RepID=A0A9X2EM06_9GAMM|nr:hypothetical protein [Microbulbifer okhotskensis]MCO1334045.1 hypothetical protein [Microbulbifer okhotskensis]
MKNSGEGFPIDDYQLLKVAGEAVVRRENTIDTETQARLRRIRTGVQEQSRAVQYWPGFIAVGACTAALFVALIWPVLSTDDNAEVLATSDWLLDEDVDIEMIENMEFYQWLAEELDEHS